jgi:alanine racemase
MPLAEIDLRNYRSNIRKIKEKIGAQCRLMALVKSDAYGFGMEKISQSAFEEGVRWFGVAAVDEARRLKKIFQGNDLNIVMVCPFSARDSKKIVREDIIPVISSLQEASSLSACAAKMQKTARVHVAVDTGMGRAGFSPEDVLEQIKKIAALPALLIEGICSHFPSADEEGTEFTRGQIEEFSRISAGAENILGRKILRHIANSAGIFRFPASHGDIVRCGIASYGASPSPHADTAGILPVMSVRAKVVLVKKIPKGHGVSYARTYIAPEEKTVALVDIGYSDGLLRSLSSRGHMLVKGRKAPILGRVTMDLTVVDVSGIPGVKAGAPVTVIGEQDGQRITAEEVAQAAGTISYEIFCLMGRLIKRKYIG